MARRLTLSYCEDPKTGLPRLEDPSGALSAADLAALGQEVGRRFERLAGGPDVQLLELDGPAGLPNRYRVTVTERGKRCPTLLLEADDGTADATAAPPGRWQAEFLAEVAEWLAGAAGGAKNWEHLEFVLGDLRALLRKDPRLFLRLLVVGYLHVGDAVGRWHFGSGVNEYTRAAQILARTARGQLPDGALEPLLTSTPPQPHRRRGWLRRLFGRG